MRKGRVEEYGYIVPGQAPPGCTAVLLTTGQTIRIDYVPTQYGSRRYFLCPQCEERRGKLYLKAGTVACRECHGLNYRSSQQNHNRYSVIRMRADRVARKLGVKVKPPYFDEGIEKPKGMHWATYSRLMLELRWCSARWAEVWLANVERSGFLKR